MVEGTWLVARVHSELEQWLFDRAEARTLGVVLCVQRAGDRLLTSPGPVVHPGAADPRGGKVGPGECPRVRARHGSRPRKPGCGHACRSVLPRWQCGRSARVGRRRCPSPTTAIGDPEQPLVAEEGQHAAWMRLDLGRESCFPDDVLRVREYVELLRSGAVTW